jgi:hypothetical protein
MGHTWGNIFHLFPVCNAGSSVNRGIPVCMGTDNKCGCSGYFGDCYRSSISLFLGVGELNEINIQPTPYRLGIRCEQTTISPRYRYSPGSVYCVVYI